MDVSSETPTKPTSNNEIKEIQPDDLEYITVLCQRQSKCSKELGHLHVGDGFLSASLRCTCGARYYLRFDRTRNVAILELISKFHDELSIESVEGIYTDPSISWGTKSERLSTLKKKCESVRRAYDESYGTVIFYADQCLKSAEWKASQEQEALFKPVKVDLAATIIQMALAINMTMEKKITVQDKPLDPMRFGDPAYLNAVALAMKIPYRVKVEK